MRILVVNDDGIDADGLEVLNEIVGQLSDDVWIVAPERDQSGVAHALSLHHPLRLKQFAPKRFAVSGTPTDCVLMAVHHIMPSPPDLVVSGVNIGHNIGDDVHYSGTVAGALEASLLGIPAIALSQSCDYDNIAAIHWQTARHHAPDLIKHLLAVGLPSQTILNINFPDTPPDQVAGVKVTSQGIRDQSLVYVDRRSDGRNFPYYWLSFSKEWDHSQQGDDVRAIHTGYISITPIKIDMTDQNYRKKMINHLEGNYILNQNVR